MANNLANGGQSALVPSTILDNLASKAQPSYYNPLNGDSQSAVGNLRFPVAVNLSQSPSGCMCSCNKASAANDPSVSAGIYNNSSQVNAKSTIQAVVPTEAGDPMPTSIVAQLTFNGITQAAQTFNVPANLAPGTPLTLAVQAANPIHQTGRYGWQLKLTANYANGLGSASRTLTGSALVVDPDQAGTGWSFGMIDQLIPIAADANGPAGVIRVYGTGGASFYQAVASGGSNPPGSFISPASDNGTLVQNSDGSYTYTTPGGVTFNFNSAGQEVSQVSTCGCIQYTFTYDGSGRLASMTGTDGAYSTFNYQNGLLASIAVAQSAGGLVMRTYTFTHDPSGNLTSMTNPDGSVYNFSYDADSHLTGESLSNETNTWTYQDGELATIQQGSATPADLTPSNLQGINGIVAGNPVAVYTDPNGNTTTTTLDSEGRPLQQVDALGNITTWLRNANGYVTSMTDPNGNITNYQVDAQGYVLQTTYPDGSTEQFQYNDPNHNLTRYTDQNGHTTTYTYDSDGHMLSQTDPLGNTTTYTWSHDLMATMTDPNGGVTQYFYDSARRLIETIDPMGFQNSTSYDSNGFVASATDANGNTTTYVNDPMGRVLQMTTALGNVTKSTYDANSNLLTQTDPNGNTTQYVYSDRGLLVSTTDALGNVTTESYDNADNLIAQIDPLGNTTHYGFDAANRQISATDPLGNTALAAYDPNSNIIALTDPNGNAARYVYDSLHRRIETVNGLGNVFRVGYDGAGDVISQTDAAGNTTTYHFDAANRLVGMTDALGNSKAYRYDKVGNLISTIDRDRRTTENTYDADNRLIRTVWIGADNTVTDTNRYQYDANGNLLTASDNAGTYTMTYDADNRLATQTDPFGLTLAYGYDANGNTISVKDSLGGLTTSVYDGDNRLVSRQFNQGGTQLQIDFTYDGNGNVLTETRYEGREHPRKVGFTQSTYDSDNRVAAIQHQDGKGKVLASYAYSYDAGSRLTSQTVNGAATNYSYDKINELTADGTQTYSYDANENRTSPGYVTGPNNELETDGTWNYSYDAEGNLVEKVSIATGETWTYTYNNANQLTSATDKAADGALLSQSTYTLDVFGNRIAQAIYTQASGITTVTQFAYDNAQGVVPNIWADLNATGSLTTRRIFGDGFDQPLARIDSNGIAWYLADRLGSIRDITNPAGQVIDHIVYDAFGKPLSQTDPTDGDRYKYVGMQYDWVQGEYNVRQREDDPRTNRFNQQDPVAVSATNPNPYPYAGNYPTSVVDPTGTTPFGPTSYIATVPTLDGVATCTCTVRGNSRTTTRFNGLVTQRLAFNICISAAYKGYFELCEVSCLAFTAPLRGRACAAIGACYIAYW